MQRLINLGLLFSSLICYLEWRGGNSTFLFQIEYDLFFDRGVRLNAFASPLVFIPLLGQVLVLFSGVKRKPNVTLTLVGMIFIGMLVGLVLAAGLMSANFKIIVSTLPFIGMSVLFFLRKDENGKRPLYIKKNALLRQKKPVIE
jgi:hypothetical protein